MHACLHACTYKNSYIFKQCTHIHIHSTCCLSRDQPCPLAVCLGTASALLFMFGFLCRLADNNEHCKKNQHISEDKNNYNLCLEISSSSTLPSLPPACRLLAASQRKPKPSKTKDLTLCGSPVPFFPFFWWLPRAFFSNTPVHTSKINNDPEKGLNPTPPIIL